MDAIREVDRGLVESLNARDVDRWLSFFANDARMMPPGAPPVVGKDDIQKLIADLLTIPNFSVAHHLDSVTVAGSGDLAYVSYSYELMVKDASGKPILDKGKDISVYRKDSTGAWKVVVDMWSENQSSSPAS